MIRATLSCGHACTQSRQNVQSRLPTFDGRNRPSSQPRWTTGADGARRPSRPGLARRPLMQSAVRQVRHVPRVAHRQFHRGQRRRHEVELPDRADVLAEAAPANSTSTTSASGEIGEHEPRGSARQRPEVEQLVGEEHQRRTARRPATCRAGLAASQRGATSRRAASRTSTKGHAVQNRLPIASSATTSSPR